MAENLVKPKKGSVWTVLLIGMFSFLITVVISGTVLLIRFKAPKYPADETKGTIRIIESNVSELGALVSVGNDIIVNLASSSKGQPHYLKTSITLEVNSEKTVEEINKRLPQIRDLIIGVLSTKTKEKFEEKEGKELVRREIIKTINLQLVKGRVQNVFFHDFVIQ